ncbi:MAG: uncharacterized protein KVP18_002289 [Porospora cf. gigantea A]|uniref:uncharacterized protein n=3 Tax=Porospora cf. gigantea A TaxID=2853593 RepID=UPI003559727D|nr:MAG: hypothetical protein KVP18_002289 [Porospora cf. gigantea A]
MIKQRPWNPQSRQLDKYLDKYDTDELECLRKLFKELESRSSGSGVDKQTFLHFFRLPGLWGERLYYRFVFKGRETVDYEEFLIGIAQCCRSTNREHVQVIFELCDLDGDGNLRKEELTSMLLNIPNLDTYLSANYRNAVQGRVIQNTTTEAFDVTHPQMAPYRNSMELYDNFEFHQLFPSSSSSGSPGAIRSVQTAVSGLNDPARFSSYAVHTTVTDEEEDNVPVPPSPLPQLEGLDGGPERPKQLSVSALVEMIISEYGHTHTNLLTFVEFRAWLEKNGFLSEIFSSCLHQEVWGLQGMALYRRDQHQPAVDFASLSGLFQEEPLSAYPNRSVENRRLEYTIPTTKSTRSYASGEYTRQPNACSNLLTKDASAETTEARRAALFCPYCQVRFLSLPGCLHVDMRMEPDEGSVALVCGACGERHTKCWDCGWPFSNAPMWLSCRDVSMEGIMYKKGRHSHLWRTRYYVLVKNVVYYYKRRHDSAPEGYIFLEGCYIEPIESTKNRRFGMAVVYAGEVQMRRELWCDNLSVRDAWIRRMRRSTNQQSVEATYVIKDRIGRGKFSVVYRAIHRHTKEEYAMKVIQKSRISAQERELIRSEISILSVLRHQHTVQIHEILDTPQALFIVMELVRGGELYDRLHQKHRLPEKEVNSIVVQLLSTLAYLHSCGIVHRDLKPENILLSDPGDEYDVKIADFGLSCVCGPDSRMRQPCGTIAYVAPEVLTLNGYGPSVDLWAVGVITFLLLRGRLPFPVGVQGMRPEQQYNVDFKEPFWDTISDSAKELMMKLLNPDPEKRITMEAAINHVWVKNPTAVIGTSKPRIQNSLDEIQGDRADTAIQIHTSTFALS